MYCPIVRWLVRTNLGEHADENPPHASGKSAQMPGIRTGAQACGKVPWQVSSSQFLQTQQWTQPEASGALDHGSSSAALRGLP